MVSGERIAAVSQAHADMQNGQRKHECSWHLFQGIASQRLAKDREEYYTRTVRMSY